MLFILSIKNKYYINIIYNYTLFVYLFIINSIIVIYNIYI